MIKPRQLQIFGSALILIGIVLTIIYFANRSDSPEAQSYTDVYALARDVDYAGVDCLSPFDWSAGISVATGALTCDDNTVGILLFEDHWDRSAYLQFAGIDALAGPNWVIISDRLQILNDLQAKLGGTVKPNG